MRRLLKSLAAAVVLSIGLSGAAFATSYDCDGGSNPVPASPPGDVDITTSGDCTISYDVYAANGHINITSGGLLNTQSLSASNELTVSAQTTLTANSIISSSNTVTLTSVGDATINGALSAGAGNLSAIVSSGNMTVSDLVNTNSGGYIDLEANNVEVDDDVTSATAVKIVAYVDSIKLTGDLYVNGDDIGGNVIMQAQNNVQVGNIYGEGTNSRGHVEIEANLAGGNTEFIIGGDGNTNGINGSVDIGTIYGGGTDTSKVYGVFYVVNGTAGSTGGITVTENSDICVASRLLPVDDRLNCRLT